MSDWHGRLRALVMAAPNPDEAARTWATLLSGQVEGTTVRLGDDTSIAIIEGPEHGLVELRVDASQQLLAAVEAAGGEADGDAVLLRDPEGWPVRFAKVADVAPIKLEAATLSHCTLLSPDPMAQCAYWEGVGFRLSETIGEIFGWLRTNPVHHSLAFARGAQVGIQHLAVELPDAGSLIAAVDAVVAAGGQIEFGPGRHVVGGNLFAYLVDETGIRWELCAELQRLAADEPAKRHPDEMRIRSINSFGPRPPASFIEQPGGPSPLQLQGAQAG
jgi:catechol 2,3-dioxygenase-like lactoylglutathione lyase family enzyme